jgi:MOSC domain-containing protein YiiM
MKQSSFRLEALLTGKVAPLGTRAVPSGIAKTPVKRPVFLTETGFVGDEQGDERHHGGAEKAVHHYPFDHYGAWIGETGAERLLSAPGAFGENLSTIGLTEQEVAVGDVFSLGGALIQVSQGRQPCWKLDERFSRRGMARAVQRSGRTGWYLRVLVPGSVSPSDALVLVDRVTPEWTIGRIWKAFYVDVLNRRELEAISNLATLAGSWRGHAARRLETGKVEDWSARLDG